MTSDDLKYNLKIEEATFMVVSFVNLKETKKMTKKMQQTSR